MRLPIVLILFLGFLNSIEAQYFSKTFSSEDEYGKLYRIFVKEDTITWISRVQSIPNRGSRSETYIQSSDYYNYYHDVNLAQVTSGTEVNNMLLFQSRQLDDVHSNWIVTGVNRKSELLFQHKYSFPKDSITYFAYGINKIQDHIMVHGVAANGPYEDQHIFMEMDLDGEVIREPVFRPTYGNGLFDQPLDIMYHQGQYKLLQGYEYDQGYGELYFVNMDDDLEVIDTTFIDTIYYDVHFNGQMEVNVDADVFVSTKPLDGFWEVPGADQRKFPHVIKYDKDMNKQWVAMAYSPLTLGRNLLYNNTPLRDGGALVYGGGRGMFGDPKIYQERGAWISRYDADGNLVWIRYFFSGVDESQDRVIFSAAEAENGDIVTGGLAIDHDTNGNYVPWIMRLSADGCLDDDDCGLVQWMVSNQYTSTEDLDLESKVSLYPNPGSSFVELAVPEGMDYPLQVDVLDLKGQTIMSTDMRSGDLSQRLDAHAWQAGTYFISLTNAAGRRWVETWVKQ